MKKIRVVIEIEELPDGGIGLGVVTDQFDLHKTPEEVGKTWTGICLSINEYARAKGYKNFNCLRGHFVGRRQ